MKTRKIANPGTFNSLTASLNHVLSHSYALMALTHQKLVADAAQTRDLAGELNDLESQDLMMARIKLHQKRIWMLRSFVQPS